MARRLRQDNYYVKIKNIRLIRGHLVRAWGMAVSIPAIFITISYISFIPSSYIICASAPLREKRGEHGERVRCIDPDSDSDPDPEEI